MGARCLLLSLAGTPKILSDFVPDNGLASLAACLLKAGHEVIIRDYNNPDLFDRIYPAACKRFLNSFAEKVFLYQRRPAFNDLVLLRAVEQVLALRKRMFLQEVKEELLQQVETAGINLVGIKLWAGEGFHWSVEIAGFLKKKVPGLWVFGGGPQVDIFGHHLFSVCPFFDGLCYGEGEETIVQLANVALGRTNLSEVFNIYYRKDGQVVKNPAREIQDLNQLPIPVYEEAVYQEIHKKIKMLVIDESRGCPNRCFFCIHPVKSGRRREKSPDRVLKEMEQARQAYGVSLFRFAGSSTPPVLMTEVARRLVERGLRVRYSSFGSLREFQGQEDFSLWKDSGCQSIFFGVESASETILRLAMNRRIKKETMAHILKKCQSAGIFTVVSIIHPAPMETRESRRETMEFLKDVRPDSVLVQFPGIYPGTPWFEQAERFGFSLDREKYPRQVMGYQIKSLFPPRYWRPLPYLINGMPFRVFARETELFQEELNRSGILTGVSDEAYLLFQAASPGSLEAFIRNNRCWFYAGDARRLTEEIDTINRGSG